MDAFAGASVGGGAAQEAGTGSKDKSISTAFHVLSVSEIA